MTAPLTVADALRLGRVSNLPTVWTNTLAGVALVGGAPWSWRTAALVAAMSALYVAGMYLNDVFDRKVDAVERPNRPIPAGRVTAGTAAAVAGALLALALALLAAIALGPSGAFTPSGWPTLAAGIALAASILLYDAFHKGNPVSPVVMGACRMLVYVTAAFAWTALPPPALWLAAMVLLLYLVGLTYAARQEAFDRLGALWPLVSLAATPLYGLVVAWGDARGTILLAVLVCALVTALHRLRRRQEGDVGSAVALLIAAICLWDAIVISGADGGHLAWIAAAGFPLTLALQRLVPGT